MDRKRGPGNAKVIDAVNDKRLGIHVDSQNQLRVRYPCPSSIDDGDEFFVSVPFSPQSGIEENKCQE